MLVDGTGGGVIDRIVEDNPEDWSELMDDDLPHDDPVHPDHPHGDRPAGGGAAPPPS